MDDLTADEKYKIIDEITSLTLGFMPALIVLTANRLNLFSKLSGKKLSAEALAVLLDTDPRATEMLCNALVAQGFLEKEKDTYKNSAKSEEFLVRGRPFYVGDNLRHQAHLLNRWSRLEEAVKTGKPIPRTETTEKQKRAHTRNFTMAMSNIAQLTASQVVEGLDLGGVNKMIDIGGGPATYAMEFVRKNPAIHATVFDLPEVVAITKELVQQFQMTDKVSTKAGDYFVDDFGTDYDLAFLSNVIHCIAFEDIVFLFKKVWKSLNSSGRIVVKDFFVNENRTGPVFATQFAINMLLNTERGNTYTFSEIKQALRESGFSWIHSFEVGQHSTVIVGEKKSS
ncbi:MAG: methyltransferase [bacterium]